MDEQEQSSPMPVKSIRSFFKSPNIDRLLTEENEESEKDPLPLEEAEKKDDNVTFSPKKGFNANDLAVRSKFTSFFCKPRQLKSTRPPKTPTEQLPTETTLTKTEEVSLISSSPGPENCVVQIDLDSESEPEPATSKMTGSSSSDSVVCVEIVTAKRPSVLPAKRTTAEQLVTAKRANSLEPSSVPKPPSPTKPVPSIDLSKMDPILQEAFLKRQAQNKAAAAAASSNVEHSVLFKIVPRVDPPRANPLFIRTRIDDTFSMLKSKVAKELHFPVEILVLVYDGVALFDSSKPSTLNLLGTKKKVNDKQKAIEIYVFTKSTWHVEQQLRDQKRKTFMENVQFLNQPASTESFDEESAASDAEAYLSQPTQTLQDETLSVSIRTNKTNLQIFNVQVPKSGKVFDIVEQFKALRSMEFTITDVKVKFDGDLLPLSTEIATVLENEDMVDLTF